MVGKEKAETQDLIKIKDPPRKWIKLIGMLLMIRTMQKLIILMKINLLLMINNKKIF